MTGHAGHTLDLFPRPPPARILSYGGGVDSFAMLLLAIDEGDRPDLVIFADVADPAHADPGEWPGTYRHLREQVIPLCDQAGLVFVWLDTTIIPIRGQRSLFAYYEYLHSTPLTVSRLCTIVAKTERIEREVARRFPGRDIEMWIGFEAGEDARVANDPHARGTEKKGVRRTNRFPLIERNWCRCRAEAYIRRREFPLPQKSACVFCPFASRRDFQTLATEYPQIFARVAKLEADRPRSSTGKYLRYGYVKNPAAPDHSTDPLLPVWIRLPIRTRPPKPCVVCGAPERAKKTTGCGSPTDGTSAR